jgi:hypothetical protein
MNRLGHSCNDRAVVTIERSLWSRDHLEEMKLSFWYFMKPEFQLPNPQLNTEHRARTHTNKLFLISSHDHNFLPSTSWTLKWSFSLSLSH